LWLPALPVDRFTQRKLALKVWTPLLQVFYNIVNKYCVFRHQ